jgi:prepilin-type processing-associated H-X9-DG protein
MVVEVPANMAVTWTKPEDWEVTAEGAVEKFLAGLKDGFNAGFADGSVRYIKKTIDVKTLKAVLTPDGGEVINNIP